VPFARPWLVVLGAMLVACGRDVDLGGSIDDAAAPLDARTDACPCAIASPDGGVVDRCGAYAPPDVDATCRACDASASDCQRNGCYNGYWCEAVARDCHAPLPTCAP
jgi:hypothetical protein